jgi:ATP-dependent exoDNAse (exonuclease V) beta subunit
LSFKKKSEGAKIRFVEQNLENSYRSTQKVLDFVDNFCNNFANKFALSFNIKEDIKHISKITQQIEDSEVSFVEIEQEVEGENEDVKNDFTSWVERTESLLQKSKIVEKVLIEITNFVNKRDGKTGIMFHNRTANNYMMFSLAEKLQEMNLLNSFITQLGRYDIKVMDIFTIFKFIQNPYNEFNLAVLLKTPIFNLTDDNIFAIQQKEKETFYERCLEFDQLKNNLLYLEQLKNCKLGFVVEKIEQMYQQVGSDEEVVVYLKYIKMLQSYIKETETEGVNIRTLDVEKLMNDFRDNIVNLAVGLNDDSDSKISFFGTIHESKGMEFDNTIIIDSPSNNGIKNTIYIIDNNKIWVNTNSNLCFNFVNIFKEMKKNLQEEELKRLYYVALTRAKKNALVVKLNDKGLSQYVE